MKDLSSKQKKLIAQFEKLTRITRKQGAIFSTLKKKGLFKIANIGENVDSLRADHQKLLGQFYQLKEEHTKMYEKHKELLKDYSVRFGDPTRSKKTSIVIKQVDPESIFASAKESYLKKDYNIALVGFRNILERFKDHALADDSLIFLGDYFYGKHRYSKAIGLYARVINQYSKSDKVDEALLKLGKSHFKTGLCSTAKSYLRLLKAKYPRSKHVKEARSLLRNARKNCKRY